MYDFEEQLTEHVSLQRSSRLNTVWRILTADEQFIEINEPFMVRAWPSLLLYTTAARVARRVLGKRFQLSTYAIENNSPIQPIQDLLPVPSSWVHFVVRAICAYIVEPVDRIAFGTPGAASNYRHLLPQILSGTEVTEALELPTPCTCHGPEKSRNLLFVGEFSDRKGVRQAMRLWDEVWSQPDITFTIIGQGPLLDLVLDWSKSHSNVQVIVDPPRDEIHTHLRGASALVLLSQSSPRWREQIGLPIMEGLAHGCEIFTTDQTGYAEWLSENGHTVVPQDVDYTRLGKVLLSKIREPRPAAQIIGTLPLTSPRHEFDRWMNSPRAHVVPEPTAAGC
ncbi:glycosyltransferase family 4 protein [Rhodococcoides fascians]|uniref:glycosyltransferase family 4 protein n=1 Tax=Rhodococcoides fascians TaxID=1828 RepID=UPI002ACEF2AB|nr:glycosyltransferase family 4 protein [Rhodococcus fascians]WQH27765.1 glycosyltransferase family 4 protein [Rhodococcus fascians]